MRSPKQVQPVMRRLNTTPVVSGFRASDMCIGCCGYNISCKNGCKCNCSTNPPQLCETD